MDHKPFIIYKSSAGSGKTYTLTLEYLKLALQSPHAFKQILAVTFTNKATQEMKERILEELKRLRGQVSPEDIDAFTTCGRGRAKVPCPADTHGDSS